eukprot:9389702-Alexandrium_andersonii.AAC.1
MCIRDRNLEVASGAAQFKLRTPDTILHFLGSSRCNVSETQSGVRSRRVSAALRLIPETTSIPVPAASEGCVPRWLSR